MVFIGTGTGEGGKATVFPKKSKGDPATTFASKLGIGTNHEAVKRSVFSQEITMRHDQAGNQCRRTERSAMIFRQTTRLTVKEKHAHLLLKGASRCDEARNKKHQGIGCGIVVMVLLAKQIPKTKSAGAKFRRMFDHGEAGLHSPKHRTVVLKVFGITAPLNNQTANTGRNIFVGDGSKK